MRVTAAAVISTEDRETYRRDGAVVLRGALGPDLLELLERGVEEAYRARDRKGTTVESMGGGRTVVHDYVLRDSPSLQAPVNGGQLGAIAAALMGTASAHLVLDQIFYKTSGPIVPTPWHQDTGFLRVRGDDLIRLWMPCDVSPRAMTVQVVRGSHRWNVVYGTRPADSPGGMHDGPGMLIGDGSASPPPDVRRHADSFDILGWDVAPGNVLAFQGNVLHGSDGHPGYDRPRRALAVLLGGPALRYHAPEGKAFPSPGRMSGKRQDDDIPQGAPIGDYETAFPACWRSDEVT